jgi:hypothetical protein
MKAFPSLFWLLLLLPLGTRAGLYDSVRGIVQQELSTKAAEQEVSAFIASVYEGWKITTDQIDASVSGDWNKLCARTGEPNFNRADCLQLHEEIRRLASDEHRVRSYGRKLQGIATSYEMAISELPRGIVRLPVDFNGVVTMWGTGTGAIRMQNPGSMLRTRELTESEQKALDPIIEDLSERLAGMSKERRVAAVWRYRYGVRLVRGDREPLHEEPVILDADPGTERQYLAKQWDKTEKLLMQIWNNLPDDFDPPLARDEPAYYIINAPLPDGAILWARTDGDPERGYPLGDIGLYWDMPLEPVLPSLMREDVDACKDEADDPADCSELSGPILGGTYPPEPVDEEEEPVDGVGLCSQPLNRRGFLCRPIEAEPGQCPKPDADPDAITVTSCLERGTERRTLAGGDVCREFTWRETPGDVYNEPVDDPTQQCAVASADISCGSCPFGFGGFAQHKDADGHIKICLEENNAAPATYILLHELVHATQYCGFDVGYDPYKKAEEKVEKEAGPGENVEELKKQARIKVCCQAEGEAYRHQCDQMEQDGAFEDADGNPVYINGMELNAESCAEVYVDHSCLTRYEGLCHGTRDYGDASEMEQFINQMHAQISANTDVPKSCSEAIDPEKMDARVKARLKQLQPGFDVCTPMHETTYANKIGNNLCYIGQCAEQSREEYRIQGGRTPSVVGSQAFPWDSPLAYTPMGTLILEPPAVRNIFPSYNPRLISHELDLALCQLVGLPSFTPPILCALDAQRRLSRPLNDPVSTVQSLLSQQGLQEEEESTVRTAAPGLGARIGAELYGRYMHDAVRSLAGMLRLANQLYADIESVEFPDQMCTFDAVLPAEKDLGLDEDE